uniref:Hemicentin 2 n=1 Tax=Mustela putorius furo TaxID=9669 RepID=M3YMQ2_MUSPF
QLSTMPRAPLLPVLMAVSAAAAAAVVGEPRPALPLPTGDATLAIVFDVTGSMWDDLMQVLDGASRILESSLSRRSQAIANYALVPFHDPDIGPVTLTADPEVFQRELRELYVQGGGDCPEMSVGAIKAAVEVANPGSFIYVFSDARAKDYHKKEELLRLLQLKQSQVVFVLTGDCGDRTHPGYLAYEEIAATSSGQVFHLDKQQVTEVLKWVESAVQATKVHLLSTDHKEEGEHTWKIPFDPSLKEVTVSLSGPGPQIEVRDPLGRILQKDEGLNVLLNIPDSAKVVAFKPEHPGLWSIKVYSSGRHSVRITGVSNIDFRAGFSTQPSLDLNHTIEWPLQGVPISLVINSTGLQAPGHLDSVELSRSSGQPLLTLPTQPLSNGSTYQLWGGPPFQAPQERFYLKVKGQDHEGNPLVRVSGVSYSGVAPGAPMVSMPPRIHGYLHQPLLVSCSVHSTLPFRLQLRRNGARLGEERHFQVSGNSSWEIPRASKTEEGTYECTAISRAGTGQAKAQIVVTDPPPQLVPAPNITVSPGETAILSCQVLSDVPYNLTWIRDWRVLSASMGRITQLADLSLEVSDISPSDGGRYQCLASNANGVSRASVWLLVRGAPQVSIHSRSQHFSQGMEVSISCSASGYPPPHISWSREGHALQEDSRIRVDAQGTLTIQDVAPEDAGNYSCLAVNEVGTDEETVTLYYTDPPSISAVNAVVLAAVGDEAVLVCDVSGVPPPRVIWYRGTSENRPGTRAGLGENSGTLRIPAARERDAGTYTCRAVNEMGDASAEIRLEVGHAPRLMELPRDVTVELGKSALLACRASGRPPPKVTWRRGDGQPLGPGRGSRTGQPDSGVLFFESVVPEDQAQYVCEAQNMFGKVRAEAQLVVTGHVPPQIASSASTVRVLERQPVSLPCIILAGRPFPERRWLRAGLPLPPGSRHSVRADGSLHLDRALQEDAGRYSCVVTNTAGSQHRDVDLVVQVKVPPRIQPTATHHVTNEGVPASLPCVASGVPTPTITWTKETNVLNSGGLHYNVSKDGTLVIVRPSPQDAGAYVCTATNAVGFSSQEMRLSVNTEPRIRVNGSHDAEEPLRVMAKAGEEVTLDCEAQGSPPPLVTWTKDFLPVPSVTDRQRLLPSGSLRLVQAQVSDSGLYRCTASNPAGSASQRYDLEVQVPPQVQLGPRVLKVLAGEILDLNCVAEGSPEPRLNWSKDGVTLQGGGPAGSVHFSAIQTSDAGVYRCEASNSAGLDAWELELRVLEPPHWEADESSGLLERAAGENASLPCPARGTPKPHITWRKGPSLEPLRGRPDLEVLEEGSLFLSSVSPADSGEYECQATNEAGSTSRRAKLVVYVPPSIQEDGRRANVSGMAGQSLTLECDANGFPAPEITWFKDGQPIPKTGSHHLLDKSRALHFPRIQEGDSGLYSCRAENQAGTAQRDFDLLVLIPPSVLGAGAAQEVLGLAGAEVELECRTSGVPAPQVEWTKDGQPVLPGDPHVQLQEDGQVLRIPSSHLGDEGRYQCVAFSPAGQQAKDFRLRMQAPPTIWGSNETSEVVVMEGHPVRFLCEARGVPAPNISWFKDGASLPLSAEAVYTRGGRQLQLGRARGVDAGTYTCQASNPVGVTEKSSRLEVYVPPTIEGAGGEPRVVKAVAGRPLALECVARGHPPPTLSWHREGLPVAESNETWLEAGGSVLSLERLGEASGGPYSCVASSPAGEAVLQYSVEVQVPPQLLVADGSGQVTALVGQPLELFCQASGSPVPTLQWLQNGRPAEELPGVRVTSQGAMLRISHVELGHAGLFACQATNEAGTAGAEVELSVHELPLATIVGGDNITVPFLQPVTLQCVGTGVPTPSLRWWKDGVALAASGGKLQVRSRTPGLVGQIEKVDLNDEGFYTCAATSLAGESKRDVALKVLVPPNIEPGPLNKAVLENASVTLECLASGVPPPDTSWFKGRQPVSARKGVTVSADGRALHIERARVSDAGSYRCVATNVAGSTELRYGLRVNVPPRITLPPSLPGPVLLNAPVRLTCDATGTPSPTLMWLKDGNPVSTAGASGLQVFPGGRVLTLASARASDSGSYSCVAVSAVGEDRRDVVLFVHTPPSILGEELNVSVVANESVTLECQSQAVPPPVLSWRKDGRPLEPRPGVHLSADKALLEVSRAELGDAGRYTCEALNQAGRSEKHYNLNVWVPPAFPSREPRTLTVTEGQPTRLSCECRGIPFPKITWKKDGRPLPGEGNSLEQVSAVGRLLYLGQAQQAQDGTYTCECSNVAGNSSQDQLLEVHGSRKVLVSEEGAPSPLVRLRCHSLGLGGETEVQGVCLKPKPSLWPPVTPLSGSQSGLVTSAPGTSLTGGGGSLPGRAVRGQGRSVQPPYAVSALCLVPPQLIGDLDSLTNISATLHSPLTLLCEATGVPPPGVRWFRGEEPISPGEDTYLLAGGWMLRLTWAQEQDTGFYSCLASNEAGEVRRNFSVEVLVPPRIENEDLEEAVKVPEGQTAHLMCNATGYPQPKVTWFKDGRPLAGGDAHHISPDGALLQVLQANLSSSGHYSCIAANTVGEKTKHFQLSVLVVPTILGVTEDSADEEVTVTINNPISLICEALAFPSPTISWMKDGAPFEASNNIQLLPGTHGLQILNAQKEDAGQYTCVVTNELGEAMKNYHVEVLSESGTLWGTSRTGGKVRRTLRSTPVLASFCHLHCGPSFLIIPPSHPQPVTPNPRLRVLGEGRLLQIQPTQVSDSGRYLCVASNVAGEDDQDFNVLIQVPPMFQKLDDASAAFEILSRAEEEARGGVTERREVVENNPAYLYCDTNAIPPPELTWYREDQPLSATDGVSVLQGGRVLQIPLARAEDAGRYSCKASNEAGEDWLHYELLVLTPPVILGDTEELVEEMTVNASSTVSLHCPALGNPMPSISWLQNGLPFSPSPRLQVLEDGQVLQVSTAEVADAASYMCVAENPAGSSEKLFTLRVQAPPRITGPNSEQVTAIINSSISLSCDVHAHPSPEVTWSRDSQPLSLGKDVFLLPGTHMLQLARVQPSDSGTYTCEALNAAGQDQKLVQLSVLVPPTFRRPPSGPQDAIAVRARDKAILSCETDSLPEPTVTWLKDGQPLVLAQRTQALLGGQRLEIRDAQVLDKGLYSCKVSNPAGEAMRTFVLTVQVPPVFENPKTEKVSQVAGSPLVLSCDVTGVPAPAVSWLKDRMPVVNESSVAHGVVSRGGRLQLSRVQPAQAGTYTCVAENAQAEARKDFVVAVLEAPQIRSSGASQEHSVLEGQEVRLDCEVDGHPPPDVTWLKDGGPLDQGVGPHLRFYVDGSGLVLKGLKAEDSGAYTCVAHNAAGEDARLHTVSVLVPPTIEQWAESSGTLLSRPGELVTMACPVRGSAPIRVSWLKDGLPLPLSQRTHLHSSGRTLRISQVQLADSGVFTCVAANPAGVTNRNFTLQVHVPPVLEPVDFQNDVMVVRGSSVVLPCEAQGSPLPLVSWMKDGEPLLPQSLGQGPSLQLETVGAGDSGTYSCVAVSEAGEAKRHFQLTVMDPPHIEDSGQPAELSLTPGSPLELRCDARGTPLPNITWHKDGQALSRPEDSNSWGRRQRLTLPRPQVGDAGLYTCLAQSPAGEVEKSFRVRVQGPPHIIGPRGPRSVVGLAPGQLVLECSVEAEPAPEIEWHRDGILLQADTHTQFPEDGRFLQLQALSTADGGNYSCTAHNAAGSTSVAFHVDIHTVPTIQPGPATVNASVNQTALLPCQVDGTPPPLVSWRKDGAPLDPASPRLQVLPEGSLRIRPVLAQDAGHYLCLASNSAGSDRQGRDLQVFEPPAISPGPSNLTLTAHTPASLPCEASGSPKPRVVWWKDGQKLDFHLQQGAYRLLPSNALLLAAPGPQDSAQFECVVSNEMGEARRLYQVTVQVPPTIADDQTDFTVTKMAPVVLTCHSTGVPVPVVSWSKAGAQLGVRGNGYRILPSGALEIGQALPIHTGRYTCTARNSAGVAHKHVVLTVQASPVVKPLPSVVRALVAEEVLLPCEASGIPRPSISWQKEGLSIPADPGASTQVLPTGELRITHASPEDAGNYFCLAQNSAGSAVGRTRLVVQGFPVTNAISVPIAIVCVLGSHCHGFTRLKQSPSCPDRGQWPVAELGGSRKGWRKGLGGCQPPRALEPGQPTLAEPPSPSSPPLPTVPPVIETGLPDLSTTEGSHALLPCVASGSPEPSITWEKDGQPVSGAEGKFTIQPSGELLVKDLDSQDAGTYTCVAENAAGRARRRVHLSILTLPAFTTLPGDRSLRLGDRLWLRCAARGSPTPRIGWTINNRPVTDGVSEQDGGSTLQRVAVTREDSGTYVCWAENRVGRVQAVSFVHVKEAPVLQGEAFSYVVEPVGSSVRLDCVVHGAPAPDIRWIKDSLPLRGSRLHYRLQNGSLTIRRTEIDDAGQYQCIAENEVGAVEKVVILVLQSAPVFRVEPQDVTARAGEDVALQCQASGEPVPTVEWLRAGQPLRASRRLRTLPDGSLWLQRVEARDAGAYECVAHNLLGSATARAVLAVRGTGCPRSDCRGQRRDLLTCPPHPLPCQLPESSLCLKSQTWEEFILDGNPGHSCSPGTDDVPRSCEVGRMRPGCPGGPLWGSMCKQILPTHFCPQPRQPSLICHHTPHQVTSPCLCRTPSELGPRPLLSCSEAPTPDHRALHVVSRWFSSFPSKKHTVVGIFVCSPEYVYGISPSHGAWRGKRCSGRFPHHQHCLLFPVPHQPGGPSRPQWRQRAAKSPHIPPRCCWKSSCGAAGARATDGMTDVQVAAFRPWLDAPAQRRLPAPPSQGRAPLKSLPTSFLHLLPGEPRGSRGSMSGVINGQEFSRAILNTSMRKEAGSGATTIHSSISHVPASVGPLMRALVVTIAPIYWALAGESGDALNGHSLTGGSFLQKSHVEFATGELLTMTQEAWGLDPDGLLLLDVEVSGGIPESLAEAELQVQDFEESYVQTGPGHLFVGSTQHFLRDGLPTFLRCNHSVQYKAAQGLQPPLVQHLRASAISSAFDPKAEALHFQLTTALQADENEVGCPEGFELDAQGEFCVDRDECSEGPTPCSHSCHNAPGRFSCSCPLGFALARDDRNCRDVDECAWDAHLCQEGQRCVNLFGSYHCLPDCRPGFRVAPHGAGCEAPSLNQAPTAFPCVMRGFQPLLSFWTPEPSYSPKGRRVREEARRWRGALWPLWAGERLGPTSVHTPASPDVDECLEESDECHFNQICENTPGGHHCSCPRGYRTQSPGLPCLDINECLQLPQTCAFQCQNLQGGYRCLCPQGQTLLRDGKTCIPLERSDQNVTTVSHRGPLGPWLRPRAPFPRGSSHAWVSLRPGSRAPSSLGRAWCPAGFIRQNGICTDLDECQVRSLCQHACRNTEGSYQCLCPAGYRLLPSGKNCQDINECEEDGIECGPSQMCFNTRGSYQCVDTPCPATYRQGSSPGTCFRRCSQDCSAGGPSTLLYKLLPLPLGVRAHHDVARLAAFSEAGVPANRTELSVLEPDPRSPFALRPLRAGQGAVYTRRALTRAGLYRLTVRAAAPRHQSVFVLLIAVSPYPY